ncbi:hypothetical protein C9I98_06875 [Photobacterium sanctipauli]|uniref:Uncharacterized protein n=1 Tax=Photobacterium sanctipauli TaxID=1342794 RepID=A0A2T3NWA3_9GAMM|nr:hypothetical protein [Photobacterium sanctipauli]PSW20570.1 hypothetical protein C9I98_06875 [Photobacterium sanctipauli]
MASSSFWPRVKQATSELLDFSGRVWVINIHSSTFQDESFVINEDNFSTPLQWMKKRGYEEATLQQVENMKVSQVLVFHINGERHRLLRVK